MKRSAVHCSLMNEHNTLNTFFCERLVLECILGVWQWQCKRNWECLTLSFLKQQQQFSKALTHLLLSGWFLGALSVCYQCMTGHINNSCDKFLTLSFLLAAPGTFELCPLKHIISRSQCALLVRCQCMVGGAVRGVWRRAFYSSRGRGSLRAAPTTISTAGAGPRPLPEGQQSNRRRGAKEKLSQQC